MSEEPTPIPVSLINLPPHTMVNAVINIDPIEIITAAQRVDIGALLGGVFENAIAEAAGQKLALGAVTISIRFIAGVKRAPDGVS